MSARFVDPTGTESAKIATSRVGSTRARMVISRLAPMPPNAVPVSSPANANAAAPSVSSATTTNRSVPAVGHRCDGHERCDGHHRDGGGQHQQWRRPEHLAGAARGDGLLAGQLAQVTPRLQHARSGAALQPCPDLAHHPDQQR